MNTLFPVEPVFPPGFSYTDNFISEEEEDILCKIISRLTLKTFVFRGYTARRKVMSYGYDYHFDNRSISKGEPIPPGFNFLVEKVARYLGIPAEEFTELLVTEYPQGSVINWHRDAPPFELIAGISLVSDCKFKLRPYDKSKQSVASTIHVPVKRRSLYIIKGEAREEWEHCIDKMKTPRYSITLRTMRNT